MKINVCAMSFDEITMIEWGAMNTLHSLRTNEDDQCLEGGADQPLPPLHDEGRRERQGGWKVGEAERGCVSGLLVGSACRQARAVTRGIVSPFDSYLNIC
jgi:hypothetical protein